MKFKSEITILTTTYNRSSTLVNLYESLLNQTSFDFNWLIIDDGSTDNTAELIKGFDTSSFTIHYIRKNNGGKHTSINYGLKLVETELVMIVDSDDVITFDAIESILKEWEGFKEKENLAGMIFLKENHNGEISGGKFPSDRFVENLNAFIFNSSREGEYADIWRTSILKEFPYPEIPNEKYVAESTVWINISKYYNMLFVNKAIYKFEYLEDGLTDSGRKLRLNSPKGSMINAKMWLTYDFSLKLLIKNMILYICYGLISGCSLRNMYEDVPSKKWFLLLLPVGILLRYYWQIKFT